MVRGGMWEAGGLALGVLLATGAMGFSNSDRGREAPAPTLPQGSFNVHVDIVLPGSPDAIYDALTGDITPWWDHSFSGKPARMYIEAKPQGGFYEIFDGSGDGVLHATVIYAQRGKRLTFDGPLGFLGAALKMVTTYNLAAVGADSTRLSVVSHGVGEMDPAWPAAADQVWHHFIIERFKPYIIAHQHSSK
jgi:hypothetical protein